MMLVDVYGVEVTDKIWTMFVAMAFGYLGAYAEVRCELRVSSIIIAAKLPVLSSCYKTGF